MPFEPEYWLKYASKGIKNEDFKEGAKQPIWIDSENPPLKEGSQLAQQQIENEIKKLVWKKIK
jgi:hypothetical protein